jgi:hypothetical protein
MISVQEKRMSRLIFVVLAAASALLAQTTAAYKDPGPQIQTAVRIGDAAEFGPIGITTALAGPVATVTNAPYSAQAVTERIQTLADGNRIEQSTSGSVARDSQGRVRREEGLPGLVSSSGDAPHLVIIMDPVAGVHWTLDSQTKSAIKMPAPQLKDVEMGPSMAPPGSEKTWVVSSGPNGPGADVQVHVLSAKALNSPDSNVTKTDLGTQNIEGVPARGTRTTRTLPAGSIGNELPIVITTEIWYSPDLKVLVMSKTSDPRMGETSYKLTNIQRSEPPASLFQVPEDYTIKDQSANAVFLKKNP